MYFYCNSGSYKAFSNGQFTIYVSSSKVRTMPFDSIWPKLLMFFQVGQCHAGVCLVLGYLFVETMEYGDQMGW